MYQKKNNRWIWKLTAGFFAVMVLLTLVSRVIYQHGIAVVTTERPKAGAVAHQIQASGKTEQNQDLAVTTVGGLRVASVQVNEGQQVKKGDLLFTLDMDFLRETILHQEQEMKKQKLSIQDAWNMAGISQKQRENQKAQAQEAYDSAVSRAQTVCDRAERDLQRAKEALENFRNGTEADQPGEESFLAACTQAESNWNAAKEALAALNQEMELELEKRLEEAENQPQLPVPETEPIIPQTEPTAETETLPESVPEPPTAEAPTEVLGEPDRIPSSPSAIPEGLFRELSSEEREKITQEVRAEYAGRLAEAEDRVRDSKFEWKQAQQALADFRENQQSPKTEAELTAAVEAAQDAYDDAAAALENAKISGSRGIKTAELPSAAGNAGAIGQITYDQMELALEKLRQLEAEEGKILAPTEGVILELQVRTGGMTSDTTAVLMVDLSKGCRFACQISGEDSKYIALGDKVTLKNPISNKQYTDLPVTTLSKSGKDENVYNLTVQLPPDTLDYGTAGDLSFTKKSRGFDFCVPLSALHMDARNDPYVLVVREADSILGKTMEAVKVSVKVLEKNHEIAALEPGSVTQSDRVIVSADRFVDAGSRVRVE